MKTCRLLHTADWQLGKPFARVEDAGKRVQLQQERIQVIERMGVVAREHQVSMILVAGDVFDSSTADRSTVSAACSAIGQLALPVVVIPGNHDHGGPGNIWEQPFFVREREALCPNLQVLLKAEPVILDEVILLPAPLLNRHEMEDPTAWLRDDLWTENLPDDRPRVVLAHGSVQDFGASSTDGEEEELSCSNRIALERLPMEALDYVALGDWHGCKQVGDKSWYSGTPEPDRFPKGESNRPGHVLLVEARRGQRPVVSEHPTAALGWHEVHYDIHVDEDLHSLQHCVDEKIGKRAGKDLLRLTLEGSLGMDASARLDEWLQTMEARLLRLKLSNRVGLSPSPAETEALASRSGDPLISRVAAALLEQLNSGQEEERGTAAVALKELFAACREKGGAQ